MVSPGNILDVATLPPAVKDSDWVHRLADCWRHTRQRGGFPQHNCLVGTVDDPAGEKGAALADLVTADRGLPNRHFLEHLLNACLCSDCAGWFPIALTRVSLKKYSLFKQLYTSEECRQCIDLVVGGVERNIRGEGDLLVQISEEQFYILSFCTSISTVTKMVDDLRKSLLGLTIPYPRRQVSSEVNLEAGIAFFNHMEGVPSHDTFIELADRTCCAGSENGRAQVLVY